MSDPVAIAEARAARLPDREKEIFEAFKRLGMSAPAALVATTGRDGELPSTDPAEQLVESFQGTFARRGAGPDAARRMAEAAAAGRGGTLRELREALSAGDRERMLAESDIDPSTLPDLSLAERRKLRLEHWPVYRARADELSEAGLSFAEALERAENELIAHYVGRRS